MTTADTDAASGSTRAEAEGAVERLLRLQAITASLAGAGTPAEVTQVVLEEGLGLLEASAGWIAWLSAEGELELLDRSGQPGRDPRGRWRPEALPPPLREALGTHRPVWLDSGEAGAARFPAERRAAPRCRGAVAAVPLLVAERARGLLVVEFDGPRAFDPAERGLVQAVAHQAAQALDRAYLHAEQQRLRALAEHSAALLETLLASVPIGLALLDRALRFVHVNAAWARLHGRPVEAFLGRGVAEALGGDAGARPARWGRVLATGEPALEVEEPRVDADGNVGRICVESCYRVTSRDAAGLAVVARDVTAERRAADFRRNLLGIVGHDLRNPLAAIVGFARVLEAAGGLDERRRQSVARIAACAGQAARIANDLLDLTRIEAGRGLSIEPRPARVDELCAAVAAEAESAFPGREVRVRGAGDPVVHWDPARVGQALSNLVVNALKHGRPDGPVTIAWDGREEAVRLGVHNWGPPIAPELRAHLFEPLRQGSDAGTRARGLGLGLYIASEIARAHGGSIEVRSDEASGTEFSLCLSRGGPTA